MGQIKATRSRSLSGHEKKQRVESFETRCRELGVAVTQQRRIVLQAVLDLDSHPSADEVYALPAVRKARISRATVFRTLESLVRLGVITKVCHPGGVIRYDRRIETHHHLICVRCDAVADISHPGLDATVIPDTSECGFDVQDFRVQLRGLCSICREREERE